MPLLHCLHIIGRCDVPLTATSVEAVLVSLPAKHASVLTLHAKTVTMALDMPTLRHLVLRGTSSREVGNEQIYKELFPALSGLKGLKTLCVHYHDLTINSAVDLTACVHLQHVAVHGVCFADSLALPPACSLHATGEPTFVGDSFRPMVREMVRHLHMGTTDTFIKYLYAHRSNWLPKHAPIMRDLTHLRLTLKMPEYYLAHRVEGALQFVFTQRSSLEVLELDVDCSLAVQLRAGSELTLRSLVLIAAGYLRVDGQVLGEPPMTTLKHLYLQSGAAFLPETIGVLQNAYAQELRIIHCVKDKQACHTVQMPPSFQPSNLQECCCSACPECLARAGVPILCNGAWTSDGFDKHMRAPGPHSWVSKIKRSPKIMCTSSVSTRIPADANDS